MVGASTVPEAIVANHQGMSVIGLSCVSCMASGINPKPLSNEEVQEVGEKISEKLKDLLNLLIKNLA